MSELIVTNQPDPSRRWVEAFDLWLGSLGSDSTRRAYRDAWRDLLSCVGDIPPWRIGRSDIARWAAAMRVRGLSDCTRNLRLAGISSFYTYAMTEYTVISPDGREVPLHAYNPAKGKSLRAHINPYGKARPLSTEEVRRLLGAIDRSTLQGMRDYALFLCYLFTARRNSEIRRLAWGNIEQVGGQVFYNWSGKGKRDQRAEMARPAYDAICVFLKAAGRLESLEEHDYIFTALVASATRLPCARDCDPDQPLSAREVGKLLKVYCRRAGLDAAAVHVHTLRHTAAYLRRQAGDDLESISRLLSHSSLAVTQIYLTAVEGQKDSSWAKVGELIGLH